MPMLSISMIIFIISVLILIGDIFIEGFGPLAVIGIVGVFASLIMTAFFVDYGGIIVLIKVGVMIPTVYLLYRFIHKRQLDGKFILSETLAEDKADVGGLEYFLGKEGITKTALRPQGTADFNGQAIEVVSDAGIIPAEKRIKVVDVQGKKVMVKLIEN